MDPNEPITLSSDDEPMDCDGGDLGAVAKLEPVENDDDSKTKEFEELIKSQSFSLDDILAKALKNVRLDDAIKEEFSEVRHGIKVVTGLQEDCRKKQNYIDGVIKVYGRLQD